MSKFTFQDWKDRIASRNDITGMVTHLTKPQNLRKELAEEQINIESVDTLIKILKERTIIGSTTQSGFISGNIPAVCFQEVPAYSLVQNVEYEKNLRITGRTNKVRYSGNGLSFSKFYVFDRQGRPVIYEKKEIAMSFLPTNQYWRIVSLNIATPDPNIIDWSHEREWRVPNNFSFEPENVHIVLYDKSGYDYFNANCPDDIKKKVYGITILRSILL